MKRKTIADEYEHRIPGFVAGVIKTATTKGDPAVLRDVLNFFAWEPTAEDRKNIARVRAHLDKLDRERRGKA